MKNSYSDNSFRLSYSLWESKQVNRFVNPIYALGKFSFNYQMFRLHSYITYTYTCSFVLFSGSLMYSCIGSVTGKKALFEAHYQKVAAKKAANAAAASLLE